MYPGDSNNYICIKTQLVALTPCIGASSPKGFLAGRDPLPAFRAAEKNSAFWS